MSGARRVRLGFVVLNLALVWTAVAIVMRGAAWPLYALAVPVVVTETRFFFRARTRWRQAAVLYLGFLAFCWSFTLADPSELAKLRSAADVAGLAARGLFFVLMGHVYGLPFLPLVVAANLLLFRPSGRTQP